MICVACIFGNCDSCIDIICAILNGSTPRCKCRRKNHLGGKAMAVVKCAICGEETVGTHDPFTWKQVKGWVHGPKADAMTMREYTGEYAHDKCIQKVKQGQAPSQTDLLNAINTEYDLEKESTATVISPEVKEFLGD